MTVELTPPHYELHLGEDSSKITCNYCLEQIETEVEYKIGSQSVIMACITMPCFLCWVPFVLNRFKDSKHSCPKCKKHLGMIIKF